MPGKVWRAAVLAVVMWGSAASASGSGFGIFLQGASALGQADAVVAHDEGPSSIFFNPALISRLSGTQVEGGTTLVFPRQRFRGEGESAKGENEFYYPTTFYLTHALSERLSVGLGLFNPFGLGTAWPDDGPGRYLATESEITTYNVNPVLAWQVHRRVAVAAGISYLLLDARLENQVNSALLLGLPSGSADSGQKFQGDGDGWGYNFGLLVDLSDRLSFGASYRSEIEVDIEGDVSFDLISPLLAEALPKADGKTSITLPQQVTAGLAWRASDRLTLEAGLRWEDWSSFDEVRIRFDRPVLGQTVSAQPRRWEDTFSYNLGGRYRLNDTISLLAGYLYGEDPVPDETFEPAIPDAPVHTFSAGTELHLAPFRLSLGYSLLKQEDRKKQNAVGDPLAPLDPQAPPGTANGTYKKEIHVVGISLRYQF